MAKQLLLYLLLWMLGNQGIHALSGSGQESGGDEPLESVTGENSTGVDETPVSQEGSGAFRLNQSAPAVCPTWFIPKANSNTCFCGDSINRRVYCNEVLQIVGVIHTFCMTHWNSADKTILGPCPYNFFREDNVSDLSAVYLNLPTNVSELNDVMCGPLNREGLLCGQCKNGFNPAVYAFDYRCLECSNSDWGVFLSVTLLPTTAVFLLVMIFRINANAPPLAAFVLCCQVMSTWELISAELGTLESLSVSKAAIVPLYFLYTIYGFWNLDFLTTVIPPYCLPGVTNAMEVLALEYLVAFYPLVLVLLAYLLITIHNHNFRPVVMFWSLFHKYYVKMKRKWDPDASVINTFATFILLSYWKISNVSFDFLNTSDLYSVNGKKIDYRGFYYDAAQELFQGKHLPFGLLAVAIIVTFVVLPPLFLCLYPTRLFRKFLWYIRIRGHGIVAFTDVFQGAYKDGTEGTRDWRFMSGAYFTVRILVLIVSSSAGTLARRESLLVLIPLFVASALAILIIRPYKHDVHTVLDSLILVVAALNFYLYVIGINQLTFTDAIPYVLLALHILALLALPLLVGAYLGYTRRVRVGIKKLTCLWKKVVQRRILRANSDTPERQEIELPDIEYRRMKV